MNPGCVSLTGKNKDLQVLVDEVEYVLDYSRKLAKYANEEDLMPGLGHVNLSGGVFAQEGKAREVRMGSVRHMRAKLSQ